MVNFVRCGALQGHVRTVGVVPTNGTLHVEMEQPTQQRHRGQGTRAFLQRADEAFHDRNTAALADGAETLADGVAATPLLQAVTTELLAPVGNQMPRRRTDAGNDLAEKGTPGSPPPGGPLVLGSRDLRLCRGALAPDGAALPAYLPSCLAE